MAQTESSASTPIAPGESPDATAQQRARQEMVALVEQHAQRVISKIPLLGAVSWLMMQQSATRHTLISELEWRVLPPLVLEQAKLYMRDGAPVAYVSWARLSDEAARRYQSTPHHLSPADWQSGDQIWLIDLYTPFGGGQQIMDELQAAMFGQQIHRLQADHPSQER